MLRFYFLQHGYDLWDLAVEEALYDMEVMCEFAGIDLGTQRVVDESTICRFHHLLQKNVVAEQIFEQVKRYLIEQGREVKRNTIVDARIMDVTSSI